MQLKSAGSSLAKKAQSMGGSKTKVSQGHRYPLDRISILIPPPPLI